MQTTKTLKLPKVVYTAAEENWLVINALKYRAVIENKKTDGATKRDKDQAWDKITNAFNIAPPGQVRSTKSLREKYAKIKQTLRNRVFHNSKDIKQTGGGPPKADLPALSEPMKELFLILQPSTYGLPPVIGDNDEILADPDLEISFGSACGDAIAYEENYEEIFYIEDDDENANKENIEKENEIEELPDPTCEYSWERANPAKLRKVANPLLKKKTTNKYNEKKILLEQKQQFATKKQELEISILECEKERYSLERRRASMDAKRAEIELERASPSVERDRSVLEFKILKDSVGS